MMNIWDRFTKFIGITKIGNEEEYLIQLDEFKINVKNFYKVGSNTFLTRKNTGYSETLYQHVLRYYVPHIAQVTFDKFKLGPGIFTMQGYERRNKESKNIYRRFNNHKGNILTQNLKRLWDLYHYEKCMF